MSTETTPETSVRTEVVVDAPVDDAFTVFTKQMPSWWDPNHHILEGEVAEMRFDAQVGGHIYDVGVDGSECRWARVLAYDPPNRVVFSWDIGLDWKLETDLDKTSEVEVTFIPEGEGRTRVVLEHRNLDRHGPGWENMRGAVGSDGGWAAGLRRFADAV